MPARSQAPHPEDYQSNAIRNTERDCWRGAQGFGRGLPTKD